MKTTINKLKKYRFDYELYVSSSQIVEAVNEKDAEQVLLKRIDEVNDMAENKVAIKINKIKQVKP